MLKISQAGSDKGTACLRLEGRMVGPWVDEVRAACKKLLSKGRKVKLDLTEVSFADSDGVEFLKNLAPRSVTITGCSLFVEEQLKLTTER